MTQRSILLIGSTDRAGLAICRSLGSLGHSVSILRLEPEKSAADASRFNRESLYIGQPNPSVRAYVARLLDLLREKRFDYVLPVSDEACEVVYSDFAAISSVCRVIGPTPDSYGIARNKHAILQIARRAGLDVPDSLLVEAGASLTPPFLPCFIKPIFSANVRDDYLQTFKVSFVSNPEVYEEKLRDDLYRVPLLVQGPVGGHGVGINFASYQGKLLGIAVTVRLHEPPGGGGSSYRVSGEVTERERAIAESICAALDWTGFMMIETRRDADRLYIMELNTRPWGSLPLTIHSGVDLPRLLVEALEDPPSIGPTVVSDRRIYARYFRRDLGWLARQLRKGRLGAGAGWVASLGRVVIGRERWDVECLGDPAPALAQWQGPLSVVLRRIKRLSSRFVGPKRRVSKPLLRRDAPVVFVCRGNINRSVVAARLLKAKGWADVTSASLMSTKDRKASHYAEQFLKERGIDASDHRSRPIDSVVAHEGSDAVYVVFERRQVAEMAHRFPGTVGRVVLITDIGAGDGTDVPDPYGKTREEYLACFERIGELVEGLQGN